MPPSSVVDPLPIHYRFTPSAPRRVQALAELQEDSESKHGMLPSRLRFTIWAYQSPGKPIKEDMFDDRPNSNAPAGAGPDIGIEEDIRTLRRKLECLGEVRNT
ncbi:hypothetical protein EKO27_g4149 [Xylaria grammica]|uniref:Uncharacterized protein n=1 Tax=Xylaria grammica TaxID=363999 RepID=A0A439D979_9PEZI|nr:hypothetical protein EKO27_g4149 [Xylaria grammica]